MNFEQFYKLKDKVLNGSGDSDKHLLTLYSIAISMKSKNILELGVRGGSTTLPLLLAAKENGGSLVSVDIEDTEFTPDDKQLSKIWTFKKQDALEYLAGLEEKLFLDLVYIDDWHSYEHVKRELELLDKHILPDGIILLHDLMYGGTEPNYHADLSNDKGQWASGGPYRAVCELDKNFWEFSTIPVNNGLTILRKKYSSKYKRN